MPLPRVLDAKLTKDTEWGPKLIKARDKVGYITTDIREIQRSLGHNLKTCILIYWEI